MLIGDGQLPNWPTLPTDEELREIAQFYGDKWLLVFEDLQKVRDRTREATQKACGREIEVVLAAHGIFIEKDSHGKQS